MKKSDGGLRAAQVARGGQRHKFLVGLVDPVAKAAADAAARIGVPVTTWIGQTVAAVLDARGRTVRP